MVGDRIKLDVANWLREAAKNRDCQDYSDNGESDDRRAGVFEIGEKARCLLRPTQCAKYGSRNQDGEDRRRSKSNKADKKKQRTKKAYPAKSDDG